MEIQGTQKGKIFLGGGGKSQRLTFPNLNTHKAEVFKTLPYKKLIQK